MAEPGADVAARISEWRTGTVAEWRRRTQSAGVQRREDRRPSKRLHVPEALAITILVTGVAGCGKEPPVPDARRADVDAAVADATRPDAGADAAVADATRLDAGADAAVADAMPDTPLG
jgi:hypothetical protein